MYSISVRLPMMVVRWRIRCKLRDKVKIPKRYYALVQSIRSKVVTDDANYCKLQLRPIRWKHILCRRSIFYNRYVNVFMKIKFVHIMKYRSIYTDSLYNIHMVNKTEKLYGIKSCALDVPVMGFWFWTRKNNFFARIDRVVL